MAPKNIKRKLRRSRRSLNEIRNRISLSKKMNIHSRNMKKPILKSSNINDNNCMILPHKMVKSETITRSVLHESKQTCTNILLGTNKYCCKKEIVHCDSTDTIKMSCIESFSPLQEALLPKDDSDSHIFQYNKRATSSSLSSEQQEHGKNMYDFFLHGLSKYLHETVPALLQTDFIDKTKISLEKFYSKINTISTSKLINTKHVTNYTFTNPCSVTDSSFMEMSINYKKFSDHQEQIAHTGSSSFESIPSLAMNVSTTSEDANVCESPEYSYYPHRLN